MFDWNEDEEVRGSTTWAELNDTEDHIVPYPKGSKDVNLLKIDDQEMQRQEQTTTDISIAQEGQSGSKNEFCGSDCNSNSNFNTHDDLSAPRFDMDPWPDLPSLNSAFGKGYMDGNHLHSMSSKFIDGCTASPDVDTVTENLVTELCDADVIQNRELSFKDSCSLPASDLMQLDTEPDMFGNDHGDEEGGSFLNCDWGNIADFDDLERIFRNNGSIFGHEIIGNADELLSPSDSISAMAPPFSLPVDEKFDEERNLLHDDKGADNSTAITGQLEQHSQLNNANCEVQNHISDKADREKKLPKSRKKIDKNRSKILQEISSWPGSMSSTDHPGSTKMLVPSVSSQSFQSSAFVQQRGGAPVYPGFFQCASQTSISSYRYAANAFPVVPKLSSPHPERKDHPVPPSHLQCPEPSKHASEVQSKSLTMTPQEKIEKLRRLQKMQAMFAIQQQQQQFGRQSTSNEMSVSQTSSQMNRNRSMAVIERADGVTETMTSSEFNTSQGVDDPLKISALIDDSVGETIFYQLQDVIGKLDTGIRLCIRDSLLRLARSALERHNTGDRSSTNKSSRDEVTALINEETIIHDRATGLPTETDTNPIDRTVAHLLFCGPLEPGASVKGEMPPSSSLPDSKWSCDSILEDKLDDGEELDIKPPL